MKYQLLSLFLLMSVWCVGQTTVGLVTHYTFDGDLNDATGNTSNTGTPLGTPTFTCGVEGQALLLSGSDQVTILSQDGVNREFDREDFTFSFYFKPIGFNGTQYLISKRDTACSDPRMFFLRYVPTSRTLNAFFAQDEEKDVNLIEIVNNQSCWQHVTVVRDNLRIKLFLNGEFVSDLGTASRIDLETPGALYIGGGDCLAGTETPFSGLIDELRVYNRALKDDEVAGLFARPDQILSNDTTIFLGNTFQIDLANSCGTDYNWTPQDNVFSPFEAEPVIDIMEPGDYTFYLQISDQVSTCVATDSVKVRIIDPNDLDCSQVFLPKAFTPNDDGLNDTYGISNPFAVPELLSFEIFDRWGGLVFLTNDPFAHWDGTFRGERVNPGVLLWRVRYLCDGTEQTASGNLTVMR